MFYNTNERKKKKMAVRRDQVVRHVFLQSLAPNDGKRYKVLERSILHDFKMVSVGTDEEDKKQQQEQQQVQSGEEVKTTNIKTLDEYICNSITTKAQWTLLFEILLSHGRYRCMSNDTKLDQLRVIQRAQFMVEKLSPHIVVNYAAYAPCFGSSKETAVLAWKTISSLHSTSSRVGTACMTTAFRRCNVKVTSTAGNLLSTYPLSNPILENVHIQRPEGDSVGRGVDAPMTQKIVCVVVPSSSSSAPASSN